MEHEGLLLCSQEPTIDICPVADESSPLASYLRSVLISIHLCLGLLITTEAQKCRA
jgi:hypothetical protein